MAAPSATVRQAPAGIMLENGHSTKITFAVDPDISLWELSVKPIGGTVGGPISLTTMHNIRYETKAPGALIDTPDSTFKFGYDPLLQTQIRAILGVETTVTVTYPDLTTDAAYGYLHMLDFDELQKDVMPAGTGTIVWTHRDSTGAEFGPVLTNVAGT